MPDMNLEVFTQGGDNHKVEAPPDKSVEEFVRGLINGLRLPTTDEEGVPSAGAWITKTRAVRSTRLARSKRTECATATGCR